MYLFLDGNLFIPECVPDDIRESNIIQNADKVVALVN